MVFRRSNGKIPIQAEDLLDLGLVADEIHITPVQDDASVFVTSLVLTSATLSFGVIVLSTPFNFILDINDVPRLLRARSALRQFAAYAVFWFLFNSAVMYLRHGWYGVFINILISILVTIWFYGSYRTALDEAAQRLEQRGFTVPPDRSIFPASDISEEELERRIN